MADESDVVVELEKDEVAAPENTEVQVADKEPEKVEAKPDPAIEELKRQHAELQARDKAREEARQRAEREAQSAREDARRAQQEAEQANARATSSELDTVESGISAAKAEGESARRAYRAAMEAADFDAAAQAQEAIAESAARRVRLEEARADIEARKAAPKQEKPAQTDDPFESYLKQFTTPTRNWLRDHSEWVKDQRKNAKLQAAHYDALDAGHAADSAEYFEFVETEIGLRDRPASNGHANGNGAVEVKAHTRQPRRSAVPAAPVQNSGGGTSGGGQTVTLTPGEARAATDGTIPWGPSDLAAGRIKDKSLIGTPVGHAEFARRKLAMMKQGLYDKSYTDS